MIQNCAKIIKFTRGKSPYYVNKPMQYIVGTTRMVFTAVIITIVRFSENVDCGFSSENIDCGFSLELPHWVMCENM